MFDGSDLSLAYGSYDQQEPVPQKQPPPQPQPVPPQPQPVPQRQQQVYQPPDAMYMSQQPQPQPQYVYSESFFDRVLAKRYDVLKVVSFALIIVLAISIDRVVTFYVSQYVGSSVLTSVQEMMLRVSYPVVILIIIWLIKMF